MNELKNILVSRWYHLNSLIPQDRWEARYLTGRKSELTYIINLVGDLGGTPSQPQLDPLDDQ